MDESILTQGLSKE